MHYWIGETGHGLVVLAFTSLLLAVYGYWQGWRKFGNIGFAIHSISILGVVILLFTIIYNHYYEYHYAWSHSSNNLPVYYMISCFWEGQEGSFLLWIVWHIVLGWILIWRLKEKGAAVMLFFGLIQLSLVSMILGVLGGIEWEGILYSLSFENGAAFKIGSNPFILLRDALDSPVLQTNPDFIPADGTGLNPLLQNYWMVIHPPTLFLGFACVSVPFSFCLAGLYDKDYKTWLKPARQWMLISILILGVGIMMGAYWAYETLNFGGYWNWDPVENAVYIPWLIMVAAAHALILAPKNKTAFKVSILLIVSGFILILYATFLTRSGILGETSVHAFTDLGLSGQLIFVLIFFILLSILLGLKNWQYIGKSTRNLTIYQGDFWIFSGITILFLMALQVFIPISIPVYNAILGLFNIESNLAPPAEQVAFYNRYQLIFAMLLALFSGIGQLFWWRRIDKTNLKAALTLPLLLTFVVSIIIIISSEVDRVNHLFFLICTIFALVANGSTLYSLIKKTEQLSAGAISHIGIALILIGVLFSGGYDNIISLNLTGKLWNADFSEEMNKENLLLFRNQSSKMQDYQLTYKGKRVKSKHFTGFIDREKLLPTSKPFHYITLEDLVEADDTTHLKGDTLQIYDENTYYEIEYKSPDQTTFSLYPRVQDNPNMGIVVSPAIKKSLYSDIYTHVTSIAIDDDKLEWREPETHVIGLGDTLILNDYITIFRGVRREEKVIGVPVETDDYAFSAHLEVLNPDVTEWLIPILIIKDNQIGSLPIVNRNLGIRVTFDYIDAKAQTFTFTTSTTQKDWVILKAVEKPLINLVWLGTLVMVGGILAAIRKKKSKVN